MSAPKACCTLLPVETDYVPKGTTFNIGDLPIYETQDKSPKRILICVYDIFGFHPVTQQVADKLADAGFRVVMPDFYRGQAFSLANFPPKDWSELNDFLAEKGTWEKTVKLDLLSTLNHYKEKEGITSFGVFGFCWGGKISMLAATEIEDIQAAAMIHPAFWKTEDAKALNKPTILIPTKDDEDMTPFYNILKENVGEENCAHHRFDDMHHGFCAARADLKDDLNRKRVDEALDLLHKFFRTHVKE